VACSAHSACLRRGPCGYFRSECSIDGELMAASYVKLSIVSINAEYDRPQVPFFKSSV